MNMLGGIRILALTAVLATCANSAWSQAGGATASQGPTLTLQEAMEVALKRNGTIRAAYEIVRASGSRLTVAKSAYAPAISLNASYLDSQLRTLTGNRTSNNSTSEAYGVGMSWTILDSGQREYSVKSAKQNLTAQEYTALDTLRNTLFRVYTEFYEVKRTQELRRVSQLQVERAKTIYDSTKARVDNQDAAAKDLLQAEADLLNAQVALLVAENRTETSVAALKSTVGWKADESLPPLADEPMPTNPPAMRTLAEEVQTALTSRPDLLAQRARVESQRFGVLRTRLDNGLSWSMGLTFNKLFGAGPQETRGLSIFASYPLFDGQQSKASISAAVYDLEASRFSLAQSERQVRAEVEAFYATYSQNARRLAVTSAALKAAQENYRAAQEAFRLRAANLIDVLTAQVSLVTAETNQIEAVFDYLISDAQLKLATGQPVPGEPRTQQ